MTVKQAVLKLVESLPEDATMEDIQYHLYVLQKIEAGEEDIKAGRVLTNEEVMEDLAKWLE
ncbi:MAG: hypothetical protein ACYCW6_13290 [Candidatus Xenobia bacterium]